MLFNPANCRNETEVESKFIVQYLLPRLGYTTETWFQEVSFGNIRLDFLAFAAQVLPFVIDSSSPLSLIIEAKDPRQNLDKHVRKFRRYLTALNAPYGILTNGKELRVYERREGKTPAIIFSCQGADIEENIGVLNGIVGRSCVKKQIATLNNSIKALATDHQRETEEKIMKVITVYHNKGGVGKTTTVVNLAAALRKRGKRVLLIDLDSQANSTYAVGLIKFQDDLSDDIKDNYVFHVILEREKYQIPDVAKVSSFNSPEIDVVPCHIDLMQQEKRLSELEPSRTRLALKLDKVRENYDIVIIDTPPSLNLYARIALIAADYLIIPSDLRPFANSGLLNVRNFIEDINEYRSMIGKQPINILGVLPSKIPTNPKFIQYSLGKMENTIRELFRFPVLKTRIYERKELSDCIDQYIEVGEIDIPDPKSIFDFKPDSQSAESFEQLANEILSLIGEK